MLLGQFGDLLRARIGKLLGNDLRSLEQQLDDKRYLHAIVSSLWSELFVPSAQPGASSESRACEACLKQRNKSLFEKARAFMSDAQTESAQNAEKKKRLHAKTRMFF